MGLFWFRYFTKPKGRVLVEHDEAEIAEMNLYVPNIGISVI